MHKIKCYNCSIIFTKSPSKITKTNFCSRSCYSSFRNINITKYGLKTRFTPGNLRPKEWTEAQTKKVESEKNYAWKGSKVSYRGLHAWVRRKKGNPNICSKCGKKSTNPKNNRLIQWANIDGKYRRNIDDFIAMCCSCHKYHDIKLSKATQDS